MPGERCIRASSTRSPTPRPGSGRRSARSPHCTAGQRSSTRRSPSTSPTSCCRSTRRHIYGISCASLATPRQTTASLGTTTLNRILLDELRTCGALDGLDDEGDRAAPVLLRPRIHSRRRVDGPIKTSRSSSQRRSPRLATTARGPPQTPMTRPAVCSTRSRRQDDRSRRSASFFGCSTSTTTTAGARQTASRRRSSARRRTA